MSLKTLKSTRTKYRNIIAKELALGRSLLHVELAGIDDSSAIMFKKDARKCLNRISEYNDKLENTNKEFMSQLEKLETCDEFDSIIDENCQLFSDVIDCRNDLEYFERTLAEDHRVGESDASGINQFSQMIELQKQMQSMMITYQQHVNSEQRDLFRELKRDPITAVKLPTLELQSFSGDILKWVEFWDAFESSVHCNTRLSPAEKFSYLNSKLTGEAKMTISGLSISNENYDVAVNLLRERYGDLQTVVNSHYVELMNLPPATNKTASLRSLYNTLEKHMRSLEALHEDIDQNIFISMITSKLPRDALVQLEIMKGYGKTWNVNNLRKQIHHYVSCLERADQSSADINYAKRSPSISPSYYTTPRPQRARGEALFAGQIADSRMRRPYYTDMCRYCRGKHWSDECKDYHTIEDRKQKIKGSCYLCLKKGHIIAECRITKKCFHCAEVNSHHRSLCPKMFKIKSIENAHLAEEPRTEYIKEDHTLENTTESNMLVLTHGTRIKKDKSLSAAVNKVLPVKTDLEDFGNKESKDMTDKPIQSSDEEELKKFRDNLRYEDGRYRGKWPCKNNARKLPIRDEVTEGRQTSTVKGLDLIKELRNNSDSTSKNRFKQGIIEKVPDGPSRGTTELDKLWWHVPPWLINTNYNWTIAKDTKLNGQLKALVKIVYEAKFLAGEDQRKPDKNHRLKYSQTQKDLQEVLHTSQTVNSCPTKPQKEEDPLSQHPRPENELRRSWLKAG